MTLNVLLTDTNRWAGSARLAVALSQRGCRVSAVCPASGHPLRTVRAIRDVFDYRILHPLESIAAAIEASNPQLIVPCDDRAVQHLHELHARAHLRRESTGNTAQLIERSLGSPQSFPIVSARYSFLKVAREEKLLIPETTPVTRLDDLKSNSRCGERAYPVVLKADGTWGGNGVKIAHTQAQAQQFFLELIRIPRFAGAMKRLILDRDRFWVRSWWQRKTPSVIAQSYIQGRPGNCSVVCWEGKVLAGIGAEVVSVQLTGGPATIVQIVDNHQMMLCAERIARRLHLSGFFGLDFMIEEGSGSTYLIEMNPRCTQLSHLHLGKGRDLIGALCSQISGQPFEETPAVTANSLIAYFPGAWGSDSELLQSSYPDIPMGEIELIRELLKPSRDRTVFGNLLDQLRQLRPKRQVWKGSAHLNLPSHPALPHPKTGASAESADGTIPSFSPRPRSETMRKLSPPTPEGDRLPEPAKAS
jgi:hypothetical protein